MVAGTEGCGRQYNLVSEGVKGRRVCSSQISTVVKSIYMSEEVDLLSDWRMKCPQHLVVTKSPNRALATALN